MSEFDEKTPKPSEVESTRSVDPSDSETSESGVMNAENFDLYSSWSALSSSERRTHFSQLPRTEAEELFLSLKTHDQAELLVEASPLEKRSWVRLLAPDDVADLIQEIGLENKDDILNLLDPQTRREVTALLAYAEDDAGGLMSSRFARLRPEMTVDEAISYLRIQSRTQVETIYYAYVLDSDQKLQGVVSFRELFSSTAGKKVKDVMKADTVAIPVDLDQEEIGRVFSQQDLMALPVVDADGRMKGIVTFDDVANALQEEATEDMHKLGAVETLDAPYLKISLSEMIRKRAGWLLILFFGEMFTASAMGYFEDEIERAVVLALFIPLIISSGGNVGSQASTLIIRAMALGEVRIKDWLRVLYRELIAGVSLGLILGLVGMTRILLWPTRSETYGPHYMLIAATVATSVLGVVLWGTIAGSMLPIALRKMRLDPASASAPAVATLVDVTGLVIYFSIAKFFLGGVIL
jgi:magnesium transporter